jgi:hypothetical protein
VRICDSDQRNNRNDYERRRRDEDPNEKVIHIITSSEFQALTAPLAIATVTAICKTVALLLIADGTIKLGTDIADAFSDAYLFGDLFTDGADSDLDSLERVFHTRRNIIAEQMLMD